jgi:hypothetical protein
MSFVGKVLIVIQLCLTLTFMSFAGAVFTYHMNWRQKALAAEKNLDQSKKDLSNLSSEKESLQNRLELSFKTEKDRADGLQAKLTAATTEISTLRKDYERLTNDFQTQLALSTISGQEASFRKDEALTQRRMNNQLHEKLDERNADIMKKDEEIFNKDIEINTLLKKYDTMLTESSFLKTVVRRNNLETDPKKYSAQDNPPENVVGLVEAVQLNSNGTVEFVQVSLGSDDGLLKGHRLFIYRSGLTKDEPAKYLGEIKLEYLEPRSAVGRVIETMKNGIIEKGDNATSKLSS